MTGPATSGLRLWIRSETRRAETRVPIVPADASVLIGAGIALTVEESAHRAFPIAGYAAAGAAIAPAGSWADADDDFYVLGLKELPAKPFALRHRHVFFGHAYKGQQDGRLLLSRFAAGRGALLDMEYLTDDDGRRLAAFGYWAGYAGAALAVLHRAGLLSAPLQPCSRSDLDEALRRSAGREVTRPLVLGALGRSGRGACAALATAGATPTRWDIAETRVRDLRALLGHDILVNAVLTTRPATPFLTVSDVADPARRLAVISDVTCDVASPFNMLPIYDSVTTWQRPVRRLAEGPPALEIIAIDNLPALLPVEASTDFSAQLLPWLLRLAHQPPSWQRCAQAFDNACQRTGIR